MISETPFFSRMNSQTLIKLCVSNVATRYVRTSKCLHFLIIGGLSLIPNKTFLVLKKSYGFAKNNIVVFISVWLSQQALLIVLVTSCPWAGNKSLTTEASTLSTMSIVSTTFSSIMYTFLVTWGADKVLFATKLKSQWSKKRLKI